MCGRVVQVTAPLQVAILCGLDVPDTRFANVPPRYDAAPSQELGAIRQNHDTGERSLDLLRWVRSDRGRPDAQPPRRARRDVAARHRSCRLGAMAAPDDPSPTGSLACCIAGGGPAGMMLALLL